LRAVKQKAVKIIQFIHKQLTLQKSIFQFQMVYKLSSFNKFQVWKSG